MKTWKHINFEQRKVIVSGIVHQYKIKEIAETIGVDPTSVSKEVKRNRDCVAIGDNKSGCSKLKKWPFVCTGCPKRYGKCHYAKFVYNANVAQNKADINLIDSRRGIDVDSKEFKQLDKLVKDGISQKKSIYQIKVENSTTISKSLTTIYRYINSGFLTTKRMDLPYAVTYKKRKHNKKYDYSNNKIDRSNHTYLDFLAYLHAHPNVYVWQLDFLGAIKSDSKNILTFILPNLQLPILDIISNPDSAKVVEFFDGIEKEIGTEAFMELIPVILTDRDPAFSDINGICYSKITGEERCKLFYCDPYVSNQKPNVENMNKQIRLFFPKGKTIDHYTRKDIKTINATLLQKPLKSLDGHTAKDALVKVFGEELFLKLF